jgi:soluble lytic murein transglycosylase
VAASAPALHADIYRYVDASGVMHFTNTPTSERYELFIKGSINPPATEPDPSPAPSPAPSIDAGTGIQRFYGTDIYDDYISIASQSYAVPFCLVKSIIKAESNFDCRAVSVKGAQGLMQLMPDTARLMNVDDPFDPYQNIMGGTRYFRMMLNQFGGKVRHALAGYNAGPRNVERHKGIPPFKETRNYISRVAKFYRQLKWREIQRGKRDAKPIQDAPAPDDRASIQPVRIEGGLSQLTRVP